MSHNQDEQSHPDAAQSSEMDEFQSHGPIQLITPPVTPVVDFSTPNGMASLELRLRRVERDNAALRAQRRRWSQRHAAVPEAEFRAVQSQVADLDSATSSRVAVIESRVQQLERENAMLRLRSSPRHAAPTTTLRIRALRRQVAGLESELAAQTRHAEWLLSGQDALVAGMHEHMAGMASELSSPGLQLPTYSPGRRIALEYMLSRSHRWMADMQRLVQQAQDSRVSAHQAAARANAALFAAQQQHPRRAGGHPRGRSESRDRSDARAASVRSRRVMCTERNGSGAAGPSEPPPTADQAPMDPNRAFYVWPETDAEWAQVQEHRQAAEAGPSTQDQQQHPFCTICSLPRTEQPADDAMSDIYGDSRSSSSTDVQPATPTGEPGSTSW